MKTLTKIIGVAGLMAMSGISNAAPINVAGLTFDPTEPLRMQFNFTQWYTAPASAITSTANLAPSYSSGLRTDDPDGPLGPLGPFTGNPLWVNMGSVLTGVGEIYNISGNDPRDICTSASFCELTTVFGGLAINGISAGVPTFDFSNAFVNFYLGTSNGINNYPLLTDPTTQQQVDAAADGVLWLSLGFDKFGLKTGNVSNGLVSASLSVTGGAAASILYPYIPTKFALDYTADAFFVGAATHSSEGNGSLRESEVPEPSSLALLGLGMLGFGLTRVRRIRVAW